MRIKSLLAAAFLLTTLSGHSQDPILQDMLEEFAAIRMWEHEEIPIEWKMKGKVQADLNEGLNLLIERNPVLADSNFSKAIAKDTAVWQAYYYRAAARKQLAQLEAAKRDLLQVLRLNPKFPQAYMELAKVYLLTGKTSASDSSIDLAIANSKSKAVGYYLKGDINLISENRAEAVRSYSSCLEIDPNFHDARVKLTMCDFQSTRNSVNVVKQLGKVILKDSLQKSALMFRSIMNYDYNKKQSIRDLSSLIRVSPFNYLAYYFRGVLYTETRKFEKAFADFQLIIKQTAANENSFAGKQSMLDKKIDLQNAGAYALTRIYGLPDEDSKKMKQAYCYLLIYNFRGSIAVIDSTSNPNEPLAVYFKAVANEHMGNHEKALELYGDALALDDQIADAYKKRGIYMQNLKKWDNSIKDFNAVLALTPDAFIIYKLRGISNYHATRFTAAIDDFNTYLKHDSTNTEIMASRGMAYSQNKQWLEAYMDFAASGNLHALSYADMTKLVSDLLSRRDTVKAMKALKVYTTAAPGYTEGYVLQLKVHLARKEWREIDRELPRAIKHVSALTAKSDESYLYALQAIGEARKGLDDAAIQTFDRAIELDGKNKVAIQEKNKLLAKLGRSGEKSKNTARSSKKAAADAMTGDWTLARAELMDGRKIGNYPAQRFIFTKNQIITFDGFMENRIAYVLHGNKLQVGVQVFTIESMTNKEIRLIETETANPARQFFIPTDSFTITKKFQFTVNRETSDTVYTVAPGIEPQYKKENFMQDAFHLITQEVGFSFEFVVQKDGTIGDVKILTSSNEAQNKRFIQNLTKTSGSWIPGKIRGKPVSVKCSTNMWRQLR